MVVQSVGLLLIANIFMTFAWYAHLKVFPGKPLALVIVLAWGLAFFEYCFQVPANRIGHQVLTLPQLKIIQEVLTLTVFVPFAIFYMGERVTWNYFWAACCLAGAVFFIFRDPA